jgi:Hemerythrin HHE cation binding domain
MSQSETERAQAAGLPAGGVIGVLLEQHVRIRDKFAAVQAASGRERQELFDELRELLAMHEGGEETVVRPVSRKSAGVDIADARNREEGEAAHVLAELENLDVHSERFAAMFTEFEKTVSEHADLEEIEEFPAVQAALTAEELRELGDKLLRVEQKARTAQRIVGPFAAMLDGARDMYKD